MLSRRYKITSLLSHIELCNTPTTRTRASRKMQPRLAHVLIRAEHQRLYLMESKSQKSQFKHKCSRQAYALLACMCLYAWHLHVCYPGTGRAVKNQCIGPGAQLYMFSISNSAAAPFSKDQTSPRQMQSFFKPSVKYNIPVHDEVKYSAFLLWFAK